MRRPTLQTIRNTALTQATPAIAYYTVLENERTGWTGGLLVLNSTGRPLEFQCTLPVRPSRAHEILYGPTLRAHLIVEAIAPALLAKCKTPLSLVCCDQPEAIQIGRLADAPVALAAEAAEDDEGPITDDMFEEAVSVSLAGGQLYVPRDRQASVQMLAERFSELPDLTEPFERIRDAIREAQAQLSRAA